ncbi:hypothetical protein KK137_08955 [Croceibacterium sp. LX-88]|uniref:Uncharacterized protein n=1 Tax=Croceibacterium selenioxidans TaxID=2838833 RepID=A0ABS5W426_9SPHN|nr:hypothetical protein [Croceibacterium selenioxidans]MBT2134459.1 hypothetical protein [Croceibacterium selenioxidans]
MKSLKLAAALLGGIAALTAAPIVAQDRAAAARPWMDATLSPLAWLANYDTRKPGWVIAPGNYEVAIGTDAGTMALTGSAKVSAQTLKP